MEKFKISELGKEKSISKSIRIKTDLLDKIDYLANKNNISTNKLIISCIEFALANMEEEEETNKEVINN